MGFTIHNGVLQDCVVVNGIQHTVNTYIPSQYAYWFEPWIIYIDRNHYTIHKIKVEEHTLEAAERAHKYVIEHIEEILRERTNTNEED